MADDWQPGDLALCVNARSIMGNGLGGGGLRYGAVYDVEYVTPPETWERGWFGPGLVLQQSKSETRDRDWPAFRFIKVTPEEADEFDRETIALLTGKPAKVSA